MACGCPVVASRGGALPEVGGDAARYLDFSNGDEVDEWLRKMISSETPRSQPHGPSLERAASFSWKKSAQMFLDAARELITVKT
jgi:glycosyltransferase involved in cell wall biosynthesis